jgi:hypothetical protein
MVIFLKKEDLTVKQLYSYLNATPFRAARICMRLYIPWVNKE